jgi:hypothetical protein
MIDYLELADRTAAIEEISFIRKNQDSLFWANVFKYKGR